MTFALLIRSRITFCLSFAVGALFLLISISGCSNTAAPNKIVIENTTYQTGFYGDLYPTNMERTGEIYTYNGKKIYRVSNDVFDFMQYNDGTTTYGEKGIDGGKIYCSQAQYQEALDFYGMPENYVVKCKIGNVFEEEADNTFSMEHFDYEVFEELYSFSQNKEYSPTRNQDNNKDVVRFQIEDFSEIRDREITIYRESVDGLFASTKGIHYQIIDKKLYLVIHYVYGEEDGELECVPVPEELSKYVIDNIYK